MTKPENVPDWRIYFAAEVGEANGQPVMPGLMVVHLQTANHPKLGEIQFVPMSPYRLALNIAITASKEARAVWEKVKFDETQDGRPGKVINMPTLPALYDYFEQCMSAAIFSYQALETYSNAIIEERLTEGKTITLQRNEGPRAYDAAGVQRGASTPEKLATVLPELLGIPLDKGRQLWQDFRVLGDVRDAIIHLKTKNHFRAPERENVTYQLLKVDPATHPRTALRIMRHFTGGRALTWLDHAEAKLGGAYRGML